MKLLLRRDQKVSGFNGKVTFILAVRADLTADERSAIDKYKLGSCMLYAREQLRVDAPTVGGLAKFALKHMLNLTITVYDLVNGKTIECKDILEMMAAEEQLKEAGQNFIIMLRSAMAFGGEEVLEL